ncbi:hypothetical protein VM1G_03065 [Cytospora mali]|uniref:Arrestin-like N-terminal domain-containing protein n=1 Tax=Cytospora mali TaxID=578113 RepID=A0A194VST5_CYTMA|nr:hypothetical protein VM1G_03065 [Valsa mali]
MPPAVRKVGPELDIQLDNIGRPYQPGDVITGRIVRRAHAVSPNATLTVYLLGRAKTKITVTTSNGNSTSRHYYRGRFNFFDAARTRQQLHDGPIHIPPGGSPEIWEFSLEVPLTPSPRVLLAENHKPENSFLSLTPDALASSSLPSSFAAEGRKRNTRFQAYVEYHLEASMLQQGSHGGTITATLPVHIRTPSLPYPLTNFDLQRCRWSGSVSTYHLVPGMENADLTFKQKSQQFFHSSKVPTLGFSLECSCPAVIQLENPTPIPFLLRIIPDRKRTSEVLHDAPETFRVNSLELLLSAHTSVVGSGTWSTHTGDGTVRHRFNLPVWFGPPATALQDVRSGETKQSGQSDHVTETSTHFDEKTIKEKSISDVATDPEDGGGPSTSQEQTTMGAPSEELPTYTASTSQTPKPGPSGPSGPLLIPSSWDTEDVPLDVGTAVGLRFFPTYALALGRRISVDTSYGVIAPDFTTYCIRHSHRLKWKVIVGVAGETVKFEGEQTVSVIGPSEM